MNQKSVKKKSSFLTNIFLVVLFNKTPLFSHDLISFVISFIMFVSVLSFILLLVLNPIMGFLIGLNKLEKLNPANSAILDSWFFDNLY